ncbi:hypothetical protein B488_05010 [Liberibacter crescens BT-1]|uniref:Uncharacterized protein n=1 Tax=Liberibacter crescens (strain BT-1) TaxID=1215343 RepID=L0EV21_LIBCB|nr:hypothetical protein B488_05010 [Liberibacter crescens BT-1]
MPLIFLTPEGRGLEAKEAILFIICFLFLDWIFSRYFNDSSE